MIQLHPYRYPEAFRGQLQRLERLAPGITIPNSGFKLDARFMEIEHTGISETELASANTRLQHLERLIADWRIDGETTFEASCEAAADDVSIEFSEVPPMVSYVQFTENAALELHAIRGLRIEGFYMREVVAHGAMSVELTVVCQEPGWKTMDSCLYADAMKVGSRICVGIIPLDTTLSAPSVIRRFEGDPLLITERALIDAASSASRFAASGLWKSYGFR